VAMLSGWDCAWTTSLMRAPFWSGLAKWPCLPEVRPQWSNARWCRSPALLRRRYGKSLSLGCI